MADYTLPPGQPWPLADEDPSTYVTAAFLGGLYSTAVDLAAAGGRVPALEEAVAALPAPIPGPAGLTGPAGAPGSAGAQGAKGDTGDSGAVGPQGPKGDKGDTGNTGSSGSTGPAGAASTVPGPAGPAGAAGATGPAGPNKIATATDVDVTGAAVGMLPTADQVGGGSATHFKLMQYFKVLATTPDLVITGTITRDANEAATSAPVAWPDGVTGVYTATSVSTAFPGAVDAYTITHAPGGTPDMTFTQSAVTRDAAGAVTARPAVTVA